jgi:cobalt/nickel transport system permease protein
MSDALLSPAVGTTFLAGSLSALAYSARKLQENIDEKLIPLMGVLAAFIFTVQMINFTIPGTGSSGHLGGGMILAIILGPYAGFIAIASILIIQSLFFADGGIFALGCNIWNLAFYPCFIAYPVIYRTIVRRKNTARVITVASVLSAVTGLQLGAVSVVTQTLLSGKIDLPLNTFMYLMVPIHLVIGLVEGLMTAGVINYIRRIRPDILGSTLESRPATLGISVKNILVGVLLMTVITGGVLSWFASTKPDGLEWSIEKIYGSSQLPETQRGIAPALKKLQERTSIMPDYSFRHGDRRLSYAKGSEDSDVKAGATVSGVVGALLVLFLILILGFGISLLRKIKINKS